MPTLEQLANDRARVTHGEITIEYRPRQATTPDILRLMRDADCYDAETASFDEVLGLIDRTVAALLDMVISTDLTEVDGVTPFPWTRERLNRTDLETLFLLFGVVVTDARRSLGERTGTRSQTPMSGTSARGVGSTTSRRRSTGASRSR